MATILIVEDDPAIARYVSTIVRQAGHLPMHAETAAVAWRTIQKDREVALVILDHHLGNSDADGLALLSVLKKSSAYRHLPVIVCTADARAENIKRFAAFGIVDFVKKPFRAERLLADVARALGRAAGPDGPRIVRES